MNQSEISHEIISEVEMDTQKCDTPVPDAPYGPKISSITNAGIEFYWKKVEIADGYEILRSYEENGPFEKIAEINTRGKGDYLDAAFDHNQKTVYYQARSYLTAKDGTRIYSEPTKAVAAVYREELTLEREITFLYDHTDRQLRAFHGWGEAEKVKWKSENKRIATCKDGMIHAVASGETTLTCISRLLRQKATTKVVVNRQSLPPYPTGKRRYAWNPETKHWENKLAEQTQDAVIMMVGDMMCGAAQTKKQYTEEHDWNYNDSYKYVRKTTALSDFAVGNLETLMAPGWPYMIDESYINNQNNCNNPSRYLDAVLYGGFDAVTMSNNHNCDGGTRALLETIDEVSLRNIPFTGIFRDVETPRFMIVNIRGIKVGFLAYTSRYTGFNGKDADWTQEEKEILLNVFSKATSEQDIRACRAAGAEYIIAYMHWGKKNYKQITKEQEKEAQEVADAGADYIVGANPHMVQVYDELTTGDGRTVPCFYSTGNFQAYMNQIPGNRDSVMVRIRLKRDASGKIILAENNYIPYHTYKEKNECSWTPLATSNVYNVKIKVPGRQKYFDRIAQAVGTKIEGL